MIRHGDILIPKKIMDVFEEYCKKNNITGKEKGKKLELLKTLALKYMYEPGEAIGIVAAQSISEPATQMSVDYNEKIILKINDNIKIMKIGDFVDKNLKISEKKVDNWDVCDLSEQEIMVPSINKNEKIEWRRVLECSRHKAPDYLLEISTRSGRKIKATDSHSFVIRKNNRIVPVAGTELKEGKRLPVMKFLHENCLQSISPKNILDASDFRFIRKPLPDMLELDNLFGWVVGAYLSEGNCTRNFVSFSNTDEKFISNIRKFSDTLGFTFNEFDNFSGFAKSHDIRINSMLLSKLLEKTCRTGSKSKKIPEFAYSANEKFVSGLLRGYFDGDGSISVERCVIRASSKSEELIDGIALLLTRFGIFANKLKKAKSKEFSLSIPHKYANTFREKIGFDVMKKMIKLDELCRLKNMQEMTDMVSGFDNLFYNIAKKLKYPTRYINNFTKRQRIGRERIIKYMRIFEKLAQEKNININKELEMLKQMYYSDVVWDEITNISEIKPGSGYVYDLSVDGTQTFTTFDGIVTHNTMRSYTMASQSDRLSKVTHGLPRLIEIFDARKTFEKNMIIYMKPEYNSREKAKELANKIKENKIGDLIVSDSIDLVEMRIEIELEREGDKENVKAILEKHLKTADISFKAKKIYIKPEKNDVKNLRKIKNKMMKLHVEGIKGIENVIVIREGEDWTVQTTGANFKKVLELDWVDISRSRTNDVFQVYETLGIEAARSIILEETKKTLDEQGLDVDIRHMTLLADMMTFDGTIKDIGRYGVSGKKASVLARANFEETKKHLINASFYGESDKLKGVIENILIGQVAPVGTGMVNLAIDMEKMKKRAKS